METASDQPARILIVGTDHDAVESRVPSAERAGGVAIKALWPANVAQLVQEQVPDLLVLCLEAGDAWAFEVCADLRLVDPAHELPVLMMVADGDEEAIERALLAGADDVVRSSVSAGEAYARISVQLRNRRHRESLRKLRSERDKLRVKATVDPLTQVLNRGALEEALLAELDRGHTFAVMFVDVDHFKKINDQYGHDTGDNVLRALGAHLKRTIRSNDIAGRYGGEEFVVCLSQCDPNFAPTIAERHREWIEKITFPAENHPEKVTASIGVAVFNPEVPDSSLTELLKRADAALYQAKHRGRNRVVIAPPLRRSFEEEASAVIAQRISHTLIEQQDLSGTTRTLTLEGELVAALNQGSAALPVIPAVAMAALRMANSPDVNLARLARLVERDPFTAARFLAVANSPVYYRGFRIASVRDALMRMGLGQGREILGGIANSVALPKYNDLLERHSETATLAARCAQAISQELRWNYEPAYMCGLLHNLGEARVLRILAGLPQPRGGMKVIRDLVERYHAHAGAQLAEKWNLHGDIVQACALHHDAKHAESRPVKVAMLSDLFAELVRKKDPATNGPEAEGCRVLGLTEQQIKNIIRAVRTPSD
ncbi:MAG TPA: diguanylate cyclase [Polyangiales bacterium]